MAYEISFDAMSEAAQAILRDNATHSVTCTEAQDPLDTILELEQLAMDHGYDIHTFITQYLNGDIS